MCSAWRPTLHNMGVLCKTSPEPAALDRLGSLREDGVMASYDACAHVEALIGTTIYTLTRARVCVVAARPR